MSQNTRSTPNALRAHFEQTTGKPVSQLVRQSKQKISDNRGISIQVSAKLQRSIFKLAAVVGDPSAEKERVQLRDATEELASLSAFAGNPGLGEVARAFYALCSEMLAMGNWNQSFVDLHTAALRQSAQVGPDRSQEISAIINGLNAIRSKL